jgi:hypothetical protein
VLDARDPITEEASHGSRKSVSTRAGSLGLMMAELTFRPRSAWATPDAWRRTTTPNWHRTHVMMVPITMAMV